MDYLDQAVAVRLHCYVVLLVVSKLNKVLFVYLVINQTNRVARYLDHRSVTCHRWVSAVFQLFFHF
ncbi:hypothetical protein BLA29_010569 [Euroglyphus maynei]|uniref:Uncharacterized protein n=1 Tax=Euroglyphus maynei TaxID=6958 RepID=A0A1Y3AR84_EURMA|nr:hypothetical protein BLA29_010569 [Euroglyphus maynei]